MRWWWVNHGQTRNQEVEGCYLWSPKVDKNGSRNQTYDNMVLTKPGDIVFSYANTEIGAVGIVSDFAKEMTKPHEFGITGSNWADSGWFVAVNFSELKSSIRPKKEIALIKHLLPQKYSPIRPDGNGNQKFYLTEISYELGSALLQCSNHEGKLLVSQMTVEQSAIQAESDIKNDENIPQTQKNQLISARRGQGIFRKRVLELERYCRITGVREEKHLRASHIKPWYLSTNAERLDGHNGLLLAPHIDHLFDLGYISFFQDGRILISDQLAQNVRDAWRVTEHVQAGSFSVRQETYLLFHRENIFR